MMQLYPDPDDMKKAQDSIQNYLANYEKKMWVPSREEIIAQREERERLESGDTIASRDGKNNHLAERVITCKKSGQAENRQSKKSEAAKDYDIFVCHAFGSPPPLKSFNL